MQMKYLIVGLGNIGPEYHDTRHNAGFMILDALAEKLSGDAPEGASPVRFSSKRYGDVAQTRLKNRSLVLLKPSTYMNLSGEAVRYWVAKENIEIENLLVVVDDIALPFGAVRLKGKGSDGGHNGLKSICDCLSTQQYARLRFGIGRDFPQGAQIDYVLGHFSAQQAESLDERIAVAVEAIKSFCLSGLEFTMTHFNNK